MAKATSVTDAAKLLGAKEREIVSVEGDVITTHDGVRTTVTPDGLVFDVPKVRKV